MKVLFFIDCMTAGGTERRLMELMKGVKRRPEIEFELVIMDREVDYTELFDLGIKIHYLIRSTKKDLTVFRRFYKICKDYGPDIVHCWENMTAVIAAPTCKLLKIIFVNGIVVDTPVKQNIFNKYWLRAKLTFPFSTVIIGNSKAGLAAYGAPSGKSLCIYNGIDLNRFKNLQDPAQVRKEIFGNDTDDVFVVGMVANFAKRKDFKTLVNAALYLIPKHDNIRFILVGDGPDMKEVKSMVPESLLSKIAFLGKRSKVESIVNIFNVGVLLTNTNVHGEGISNSVVEYMSVSKAVIATRGGGTNELIFDNQNGYLIDQGSRDQLIEKIELLMKDRIMLIELGRKGNQMVHEKFDIKIMTDQYIKVYQNLIKTTSTLA